MEAPSIVPSLADLELALERAESRLARARYIDNYQRMVAEETAARRDVEHFKAQIAALNGPKSDAAKDNPHSDFERAYGEVGGRSS